MHNDDYNSFKSFNISCLIIRKCLNMTTLPFHHINKATDNNE